MFSVQAAIQPEYVTHATREGYPYALHITAVPHVLPVVKLLQRTNALANCRQPSVIHHKQVLNN